MAYSNKADRNGTKGGRYKGNHRRECHDQDHFSDNNPAGFGRGGLESSQVESAPTKSQRGHSASLASGARLKPSQVEFTP